MKKSFLQAIMTKAYISPTYATQENNTKEKDRHPTAFFISIYNSCLCVYKSTSLNNKA